MFANIFYLVAGVVLGQLMMAYMMQSYRQLSEKQRVRVKATISRIVQPRR